MGTVVNSGDDLVDSIEPNELTEALPMEGVQADVQVIDARASEDLGPSSESLSVGRQADARDAIDVSELSHELLKISALQGLSAGESQLRQTPRDRGASDEGGDLLEGQQGVTLKRGGRRIWYAVAASKRAPIRDRDSELSVDAFECGIEQGHPIGLRTRRARGASDLLDMPRSG